MSGEGPSFAVDPSGTIGVFGSNSGSLSIRELPSMREIKRLVVHGGLMGGLDNGLPAVPAELQALAKDPAINQLQEMVKSQSEAGTPRDPAAMRAMLKEMLRVSSELQKTVRERVKQSGLTERLTAQSVAFQANLATAVVTAGGTAAFARSANAERFAAVQFSPDGAWLFTASSIGVRAWRWATLHAGDGAKAPPSDFQCEARPDPHSHGTYCYSLAFDEANRRLLFAGLEGIVEYLDLATGATGSLLRPPELQAILRLVLSAGGQTLIAQSRELKRNSPAPSELRVWNYPALCAAAGLPG
jgi:WD40 repeat protein